MIYFSEKTVWEPRIRTEFIATAGNTFHGTAFHQMAGVSGKKSNW